MPGTCCSGIKALLAGITAAAHAEHNSLLLTVLDIKKAVYCLLQRQRSSCRFDFERCKGNTFFLFKERFSKNFFHFFRWLSLSKPPVFITKILKIKQLSGIFQVIFINIFFVFFNIFSKKTAIFAKLLRQHYCGFLFIFFHGRHPLPAFFSFLRGRCANRPLYTSSLQARLRQAQPPALCIVKFFHKNPRC